MVSIAFGAGALLDVVTLATGTNPPAMNTAAFFLLLPYSLLRWGAGRDVMIGAPIVLIAATLGLIADRGDLGDFIGASAVLLASMALGAAVRYRDRVRAHELEEAKMRERERLARDLHDTVAHHVSAIAIRAQAGLVMSSADPGAAIDALRVVEAEASRALSEMRSMVRLLRRDAELAPTPRIADLRAIASSEGPAIDVSLSGDLDDVSGSVSAAIYRLAQESITNARRHARGATRIEVGVSIDDTSVHLRVTDDGDPARPSDSPGYGLIGMSERAESLGGTCSAGPNAERGWTVTAVLPRKGESR